MKLMKLTATALTLVLILTGCKMPKIRKVSDSEDTTRKVIVDATEDIKPSEPINTMPLNGAYKSPNNKIELLINLENPDYDFTELKHIIYGRLILEDVENAKEYYGDDYFEIPKNKANIPAKGTFLSMKSLDGKVVIEVLPENSDSSLELGLFDPYANSYKKVGDIPFSSGYGAYSMSMHDRYYIMITNTDDEKGLTGRVTAYDSLTDELKTVDEFGVYNIVNYITSVGDHAIAYAYYEAETQDWIAKYHDFRLNKTTKIFRHTNFNDNETSSLMGISSDGENVALVVQYIQNGVYLTNLEWIDSAGQWYKSEDLPLGRLYGDEYEITDFKIDGDYYFIDILSITSQQRYHDVLLRRGIEFSLIKCWEKGKLLSDNLGDKSNIVYGSYFNYDETGSISEINLLDFKEKTLSKYSLDYNSTNSVDRILVGEKDDIVIMYKNSDGINSEFQIIKNLKSTEVFNINWNGGLFPGFDTQSAEYYALLEKENRTKKETERLEWLQRDRLKAKKEQARKKFYYDNSN